MKAHDVFWKLETLSDRQLLERVGMLLGSSRRLTAELIAHLGEVEERRLHLAAACSSMFVYCLKLGMTEDEAYRRIEVARLARRYPAIFPLLADGRLSISVVALLKHHLSVENHLDLLASAAGKTVAQTRELIAARFPRPDVPSSVRKLPERRTMSQPPLTMSTPPAPRIGGTAPSAGTTAPNAGGTAPSAGTTAPNAGGTAPNAGGTAPNAGGTAPNADGTESGVMANGTRPSTARTEPLRSPRCTPPHPASRVEPLSAQRYKIQLTGSAELAQKLALAKDLMRHSHPGGELGPIVEQALDLLIESLMNRRFGERARRKTTSERAMHADEPRSDLAGDRSTMRGAAGPNTADPRTNAPDTAEPASTPETVEPTSAPETVEPTSMADTVEPAATAPAARTHDSAARTRDSAARTRDSAARTRDSAARTRDSAGVQIVHRVEPERASLSSYIPRSTRRTVVERDGLGCSWVDEHGVRCGSRAWLEYDHRHPRAKGGGAEPDNVRLLCRQHNRYAAEREYGRRHVEHSIARAKRTASAARAARDMTGA